MRRIPDFYSSKCAYISHIFVKEVYNVEPGAI